MTAISTQTNVSHKTALECYTDELKAGPILVNDYERKSILWKVAANATLVAYTILSASALLMTGILAPIHVPLTGGICTWLFFNSFCKQYNKLQDKSAQMAARAEQFKAVTCHYQQLQEIPNQSALKIAVNELLSRRITENKFSAFYYPSDSNKPKSIGLWNDIPGMESNPEKLETLKPAIAWYRFWKDHIKTLKVKGKSLLEEAEHLEESDKKCSQISDEIFRLQIEVFKSKVRKAFAFLTIVQPNLTTQLDEIGDFPNFPLRVAIDSIQLFKFKNQEIKPLTFGDMLECRTRLLSVKLFKGLPTSAQSFT